MIDLESLKAFGEAFKRVFDCLDRGISSWMSPVVYKRMERAKMLIEKERSDQNALIAIKEAMTQDLIEVAKTSRDRLELQNIAAIYGAAISELLNFDSSKFPAELPSNEWCAHFYDSVKDCSDEEIRVLWSKILAGEIKSPGKYFKRTLTNLKQIEKHEAEWFVKLCKYTIENYYIPGFAVSDEFLHFNELQSLVDCGFVNANEGGFEINVNCTFPFKTKRLQIVVNDPPYLMQIYTLTDTGMQICDLVNVKTDETFINKLISDINTSQKATAIIV